MAADKVPFSMEEIFDYMQINYVQYARGRNSFNIPCPNCDAGSHKSHLNVNLTKKAWRCPKCGSYGNAVNFYALATTGDYRLNKAEYIDLVQKLQESMRGNVEFERRRMNSAKRTKKVVEVESSPIADDDTLDKTFSTLLALDIFALREEHRSNLHDRGLDDNAIFKNGYCSFPAALDFDAMILPAIRNAYKKNKWAEVKSKNPRLSSISDRAIMAGLTVAFWLKQQKCQLEGVPGFFLFEKHWCFLFPGKGLVVPTRNRKGQIVALQVRMDVGKTRYLTVSAKGLPKGVEEGISRVHWPLVNTPVDQTDSHPEVLITEGPLKADVAIHLLREAQPSLRVAFAAIQGVNNTSALMRDCEELAKLGYTQLSNALDMDRLTNLNVMNGAKRLRELLQELNIKFKQLFWDEQCAKTLLDAHRLLCREYQLSLKGKESPNSFVALAQYTRVLYEANHGTETLDWFAKTKGIDDYLLSLQNSK